VLQEHTNGSYLDILSSYKSSVTRAYKWILYGIDTTCGVGWMAQKCTDGTMTWSRLHTLICYIAVSAERGQLSWSLKRPATQTKTKSAHSRRQVVSGSKKGEKQNWKPEDARRQFTSTQGQDHSKGWQLERPWPGVDTSASKKQPELTTFRTLCFRRLMVSQRYC